MGRLARTLGSRPANENYGVGVDDDAAQAALIELDTRTALEEVDRAEVAINQDLPEGEDLSEALNDTYPEVVEILENAQEAGGISVECAALLNLLNRVHGADGRVGVAVESFADAGSRRQATRVAIEGIKATMKDWWRRLKAWFVKMRTKLKTWWEKTWAAAPRLKASAQSIRDRASKTSGVAKEKNFEMVRVQQTLYVGGSFPSDMPGALQKMNQIANGIFNTAQTDCLKSAEGIMNAIEGASFNDEAGINAFATALGQSLPSVPGNVFNQQVSGDVPDVAKVGNGFTAKRTDEFLGGKCVYAIYQSGSIGDGAEGIKQMADLISGSRTFVGPVNKKEADDSAKQVPVAAANAVQRICDEVIHLCDAIEAYKRNFTAQEKAHDHLNKAGDALDRATNGSDDKVEGLTRVISDVKRIVPAVHRFIDEPSTSFAREFLNVGRFALQYADKSLAQY